VLTYTLAFGGGFGIFSFISKYFEKQHSCVPVPGGSVKFTYLVFIL